MISAWNVKTPQDPGRQFACLSGTNYCLEVINIEKVIREFEIPYLVLDKHGNIELVIAESCIVKLQKAHDQRYNIEHFDNPTLPDSRKGRVFDVQMAKDMANHRFLSYANDAVRYRDVAKSKGLEELEIQS